MVFYFNITFIFISFFSLIDEKQGYKSNLSNTKIQLLYFYYKLLLLLIIIIGLIILFTNF